MLLKYKNFYPQIGENSFVEETARVIGDVTIGNFSSVWFYSVLRGDVNYIKIGDYTNVQDGSVLHVTRSVPETGFNGYPLEIGNYVTIGHNAIIHACKINDYCLIGMGAIILDNAEIGECSIVAAGSVVKEGFKVPPYTLVAGNPAVIKKELPKTEQTKKMLYQAAKNYFELIGDYK